MINASILINVIKNSKSYREAGKKLTINHQKLKKMCQKMGIDCSHFIFNTKYCNLPNKKINMLTILSINKQNNKYFANCKCDCGKFKNLRVDALISNRVISCGCQTRNRWNTVGNKNHAFTGVGQIGSVYFNEIKRSAKHRNLPFDITIEQISQLFEQQNHKCALTGLSLTFGRIRKSWERSASLDRIDNSKGYIIENIRWVLKDINMIRRNYDNEYFIKLCNMVAKFNPRNL